MGYESKPCSCGSNWVVNKKYWLCDNCNYKRLHGGKSKFEIQKIKQKPKKSRSIKSSVKTKNKRTETLEKDRELYLEVFNTKPNHCENCKLEGKTVELPDVFEDENGIVAIWQYSHILPKSTHPKLRHCLKNINRMCLSCHNTWDFGDKKSMAIYSQNLDIIKELNNI